MSVAVEMRNYSFQYNESGAFVLKDCNLTLNYGEFLVLSGLSGEGKSTLLSAINGVIPNCVQGVQSGKILINGEDITGKRMSEISRLVGSVLQNADSQIVNEIIDDEVAFGCENMNIPPQEIGERVRRACALMELNPSWATQTLSGGQKQRLITASTLAMRQKILVLDEPLANLDLAGAHVLLKTLKELTRQGCAVLFVEHRLDVVLAYADRVAWLEQGQVHILNSKQEALERSMRRIPDVSGRRAAQEPCFDLRHVYFSAGGRTILKEINFTVNKGERVVILGENGCGKTTLMRIIAKLQKPTAGEVCQYVDPSIKKAKQKWFKKVGFIYQNPNYQLFMTQVFDEIGYQSESAENTEHYLRAFSLEALRERHPQSLSEGQKRRLSIAAVAAENPEVLILDEPTVGQDYDNLKMIVDTVNRIHDARGITMITVTHDYRCAQALADKVIWIRDGVVYKQGGKELAEEYFRSQIPVEI